MARWPLSMELLRLTPLDGGTLEDACLGNFITGGTGSGKTSGPFQYIIRSFLRAGCSRIFPCAKKDAIKDSPIYLAAGAMDIRKGFEGRHGLVWDRLQCEPLSLSE